MRYEKVKTIFVFVQPGDKSCKKSTPGDDWELISVDFCPQPPSSCKCARMAYTWGWPAKSWSSKEEIVSSLGRPVEKAWAATYMDLKRLKANRTRIEAMFDLLTTHGEAHVGVVDDIFDRYRSDYILEVLDDAISLSI